MSDILIEPEDPGHCSMRASEGPTLKLVSLLEDLAEPFGCVFVGDGFDCCSCPEIPVVFRGGDDSFVRDPLTPIFQQRKEQYC